MQAEPRSNDISSDVGMEKNEAMLPTNIKTSGSIQEVLPIAGEISLERDQFSEVFCKPKLMAVKSVTLQKIEAMEAHARKLGIAE